MSISDNNKVKLATKIAYISGGIAIVIAFLLLVNFIQIKLNDPIDNKTIPALVKRLSENPSDEALKAEIRSFDLIARKAYFTSQWQLRTGSYLLLLSVIISVLSVRFILSSKSKLNEIDKIEKDNILDKLVAQKWIVYTGSGLFVLALVSGFLSYNSLDEYLVNENIVAESQTSAENAELTDPPVLTSIQPKETNTEEVINTPENIVPAENETSQNIPDKPEAAQATAKTTIATLAELKANNPFFRGAEGIGIVNQKNTPTDWNGASGKNLLWKVKVPKSGFSSPVIWGDKLFVTGADAQARMVYCYDKNSGKLLWEAAADNIEGSPSKMPKVTADTGLAAPTMATDGRVACAIFGTGDVIAFDMNGKRVWARNLGVPDNHYGHSSSLIIFKDKLIVQYDTNKSGKLIALSTQTGTTVWETLRNSKISWSSPAIVNTGKRFEIILTTNPNVNSYNPETGKELWNISCLSGEVGPSIAYADGMVFATNEYAKMVGIKVGEKAEIVWESDEFLSEVSSPLAVNGLVFSATTYGAVACQDALTGKLVWEQEFGDAFYSSPIYADGKIYLTDMSGKTYIMKAAREFSLIGKPELGEKVVCSPVFQDSKVFIRGMNQLYCFGTK